MNRLQILNPLRGYRPRYADVAATLALLFAMGGTAYAVGIVHTADIADGAVTTPKIHAAAVASSKLKTGSVLTGKLADGSVTELKLGVGSVTNSKLGDLSVTNSKLGDFSVTNSKLGVGSVTNSKLGVGSVTNSKLGVNSVSGSNVAPNSLSLADLVGADTSGHIGFTLPAHSCGTLNLSVGGAQVGQVALFSFTGNVAVPSSVAFGGTKVTAAGMVTVRGCNTSASSFSVSNLGIRIITFG